VISLTITLFFASIFFPQAFNRSLESFLCLSGGAELRDFKNPKNDSKLRLNACGKKIDSKKRVIVNDITKDQRRTYWCPKIQKL
jgi:hypothetical protein